MNRRLAVFVPVALMAASCGWKLTRVNRAPAPAVEQETAVRQVFQRQVRNAVDAGEGDYQVRRLRARLAANPADLDARTSLAAHYDAAGFPDLALEHYRLAAARFPDNQELAVKLARSLRGMGMRQEAAARIAVFLDQHAGANPVVYSWAGILHDEAGALIDGEEYHRQAIYRAAKPRAYLFNNLGQNLLEQKRPADAAVEFRKALDVEPRSPLARNNLAIAISRDLTEQPASGGPGLDLKEALLHMQSVADPATAHSNLAAVLIEQGRYREARAELNLALGYKPGNPAALRNLALLARLDGQPAAVPAKANRNTQTDRQISQDRRNKK
jgi:tetratricopeptide (TPR) repeat protein